MINASFMIKRQSCRTVVCEYRDVWFWGIRAQYCVKLFLMSLEGNLVLGAGHRE
jgi:hypothetical protein